MTRTLVLLRHAKSDWGVAASDRDRPLAERGRRQAVEAGAWLAEDGPTLDLAWVSTAQRARETWELASTQLAKSPSVRLEERAYAFDGEELVSLVSELVAESSVALVGHNPAMEEAVVLLTGDRVTMRTSAIAVIELAAWESAGDGAGRLVAHGRPPLA